MKDERCFAVPWEPETCDAQEHSANKQTKMYLLDKRSAKPFLHSSSTILWHTKGKKMGKPIRWSSCCTKIAATLYRRARTGHIRSRNTN
jgi:hypothetical protein